MPIIVKDSAGDYTPAPEGLHLAVCVDVVDLGTVETQWGKRHRGRIVWQIDALKDEGTRFTASRVFTLSLAEKSTLRPFLEAWRGKRFTREELDAFDLEKLIGANCQLQVIHAPRQEGGVFANVQTALPVMKGTEKLVATSYVRVCDREVEPEEAADSEESGF